MSFAALQLQAPAASIFFFVVIIRSLKGRLLGVLIDRAFSVATGNDSARFTET